MKPDHDPLERALGCLASRVWTHPAHQRQLQEKLMQQFQQPRPLTLFTTRFQWIAAAALVLVVGGVSFAAVGGAAAVSKWFTVRLVGPDGQEINAVVVEGIEDENGVTQVLELEDGGAAVLQLVGEPDGRTEVTVEVSSPTSGSIEVEATTESAPPQPRDDD